MFLHSLFFPNYLPLSDFSCFEPYVFAGNHGFPFCYAIPSFHVYTNNNLIDNINNDLIQEKKEPGKLEEIPIEIKKEPEKPQEKKKSESKPPPLFHVKNVQDELFWLVYVAIYGETEYYRNKYNYGKIEIQEKQKIAEKIQDPEFGKKMKWKWTKIQRIEMISDLTNRPQMPIAIMNALAAYYECTFILVDNAKKVYLNYGSSLTAEEKEKTYIIYVSSKTGSGKEKKEYKLDMQPSLDTLQKIQDEMFALEHYERPLKAISNYKKIELDSIATKIGVPSTTGNSESKNEVYDRLRLFLADSAILFMQE